MADAYTLILTKGVHLVAPDEAAKILKAVDEGQRLVEVALDPFGAADPHRRTIIATSHVIALSETDLASTGIVPTSEKNIRRLRPRRLG